MIILIGASASGKTELAKKLCDIYGYKKIVTTTTRPMRNNEKPDVDYHFLSEDIFLKMNSKKEFIGVTNYQGNYYGIHKKDLILNGVLIVDPSGANSLIDTIKQELFVVFVESSEKMRKQRMNKRGDNKLIIEKRMIIDNLLFQPQKIKRIDLLIKNENNSLDELARLIHNKYQLHLKYFKISCD